MSTPQIDTNKSHKLLSKWIAETLQTDVEKLDKADGNADGKINLYKLQKDVYKGRIIQGRGYLNCENAWFIDNGDGKIGEGDLFLHSDGYYKVNYDYAFRFTHLFKPVRTTDKSGPDADSTSALPPEVQNIKKNVERFKGASFKKIEEILRSLPGCR